MQVSLDKPQPPPIQKVKNILIRSFTKDREDRNPQRPENPFILKYSPKYYSSLNIQITSYNPLLSKIKKIKKLKRLEGRTGPSFKEILPQNLWFNLLTNSRKEIEEAPRIIPNNYKIKLKKSFWRRHNMLKIKSFPNMSRVLLSRWRIFASQNDSDPLITIKETLAQYLWNLRKLKTLEILAKVDNYDQVKWILKRLDKMGRLLGRLETFIIKIEPHNENMRELSQNKNVFSHLTGLKLFVPFDPILAEIPQICRKLNSLSLEFLGGVKGKPEFLDLLTSIEHLSQLKSLEVSWPGDATNFWSHFKPPTTLRSLVLKTNMSNLINEGLFGKILESGDVVEHWQEIEELEALTLHFSCSKAEEMIFLKQFVTMILKKVRKARSLIYYMTGPFVRIEPFFVEKVPHLYESLEKFEHTLVGWSSGQKSPRFDLKMMKPFRNLKELKLEGGNVIYENVEEAVSLLEESDGVPVLEIKLKQMLDENWLGEALKKIEKVKRADREMEMLIELRFRTGNLINLLERLCQDIQAVKSIQGLVISLVIVNFSDISPLPAEKLREVLGKNDEVRNLRLMLSNANEFLRFSKFDGEKEQFDIRPF